MLHLLIIQLNYTIMIVLFQKVHILLFCHLFFFKVGWINSPFIVSSNKKKSHALKPLEFQTIVEQVKYFIRHDEAHLLSYQALRVLEQGIGKVKPNPGYTVGIRSDCVSGTVFLCCKVGEKKWSDTLSYNVTRWGII